MKDIQLAQIDVPDWLVVGSGVAWAIGRSIAHGRNATAVLLARLPRGTLFIVVLVLFLVWAWHQALKLYYLTRAIRNPRLEVIHRWLFGVAFVAYALAGGGNPESSVERSISAWSLLVVGNAVIALAVLWGARLRLGTTRGGSKP